MVYQLHIRIVISSFKHSNITFKVWKSFARKRWRVFWFGLFFFLFLVLQPIAKQQCYATLVSNQIKCIQFLSTVTIVVLQFSWRITIGEKTIWSLIWNSDWSGEYVKFAFLTLSLTQWSYLSLWIPFVIKTVHSNNTELLLLVWTLNPCS